MGEKQEGNTLRDVTNSYLTVFQVIKVFLITSFSIFCSKFNFHLSKINVSLLQSHKLWMILMPFG